MSKTCELYLWFWIPALTMAAFIIGLNIIAYGELSGVATVVTFIVSYMMGYHWFEVKQDEYKAETNDK